LFPGNRIQYKVWYFIVNIALGSDTTKLSR